MNNYGLDNAGKINSDAWTDLDYKYQTGYLPKEYRRQLRDYFDKRFVLIWFATFIVHFFTALYFAINPPNTSVNRSEIDRIQRQFATFVLEKEVLENSVEPENFPVDDIVHENITTGTEVQEKSNIGTTSRFKSENVGETKGATAESRKIGHSLGSEERQTHREQISREVSSKGLLGLLTGSGSNTKGEAIKDVLGETAESQSNLEAILGNLEELKRTGKSTTGSVYGSAKGSRTQKGTRATSGGGIDDLISEREQVKSTAVKRQGNLVVEKVSSIADERGIKSESRDPDKVSEVVNRHNSSIQYCYQRELKQNPDLKGKLVVRFTITPEGKVGDVKLISSTLNIPRIERCVVSRIRRWDDFGQIDPSKGDATFRQVYTFGY